MSGNAAERIDACEDAGDMDTCRAAASSAESDPLEIECAAVLTQYTAEKFDHLGFRCCGN